MYSSVEFCSISYNHPFHPVLCASAHAQHIIVHKSPHLHRTQPRPSLLHPHFSISYISSQMPSHARNPKLIMVHPGASFHPILQGTTTLHPPNASTPLLQMSQVLPASRVPRRHVLLHAVCESGLLGRRDGRARVGDRALEAVLVDFL